MRPTDRWRQLLDERLHEAITVLGQTPGVHGIIVAGSMGRPSPLPRCATRPPRRSVPPSPRPGCRSGSTCVTPPGGPWAKKISPAENARVQIAAFTVHVVRHHPDLDGPWTATPDPDLDAHLAELGELGGRLGAVHGAR